jgi:hypothetical protein
MLLQQIQAAIGDSDVSITQRQWVPIWLLDKAVTVEKENCLKACRPIKHSELPPRSNVVSSHHFFYVKKTSDGNLKLKCRLVPHGNRDRETEGLRTDSATAQFAAIRLLLSLAVLLHFCHALRDLSSGYLSSPKIWFTVIPQRRRFLELYKYLKPCPSVRVFFVNGSGALPEWILVQISIAQWWRISVDLSLVSPGNLICSFRWLASDLKDNIFACICVPACLHKWERTCLP